MRVKLVYEGRQKLPDTFSNVTSFTFSASSGKAIVENRGDETEVTGVRTVHITD